MKVMVTGGTGFVGTNLVNLLADKVRVITPPSNVLDLTDRKKTKEFICHIKPDVLIHCASQVSGLGGHAGKHASFLSANATMNFNVIDACVEADIDKVIALSSIAAFHQQLKN